MLKMETENEKKAEKQKKKVQIYSLVYCLKRVGDVITSSVTFLKFPQLTAILY